MCVLWVGCWNLLSPRLMHIPENAVLGRGSFGTVWRARDAHTGRCYAATWHRKWRFFFRWFSIFFFLSSKAAPFVCVLVFLGVKRWEILSFSVVEQKSSWIWIRFDPHFRHRYCSSRGRSGMPFTVVWGEKCGALVAFEIAGKLFKLQWYIYSSQVPPN